MANRRNSLKTQGLSRRERLAEIARNGVKFEDVLLRGAQQAVPDAPVEEEPEPELEPEEEEPGWTPLSYADTSDLPTPEQEQEAASEEEEWTAELPPIDATEAATAANAISAAPISDVEVDNVWDWIRADDAESVTRFFGGPIQTTRQLFLWMAQFIRERGQMFALRHEGEPEAPHIGILGLQGLPSALQVHIYLAPQHRGMITMVIPAVQALAAQQFPGERFVVITTLAPLVRLYRPFGFSPSYILEWTAPGVRSALQQET